VHLIGFCYKNISRCKVLGMSKMYSIIIWPNGPCSSLQLCQTCPIPMHDTADTQNVPPKHWHLKYWLTNQTSTIFWNFVHCPLSMAKSTQCLTGWLYICLHVKWDKGSTYPAQPITNISLNYWDFNHNYDLIPLLWPFSSYSIAVLCPFRLVLG